MSENHDLNGIYRGIVCRLYVAYLGLNHEHSHLGDDYHDDKRQKHHSHSHETYWDRIYMNIIYLVI